MLCKQRFIATAPNAVILDFNIGGFHRSVVASFPPLVAVM